MRHLKVILVILLLATAILLMYDDTVDNRGTASPFDPAELTDLGGSHEQIVLAVFILMGAVIVLPLSYIRHHPFKTALWVGLVWLLVIELAIVTGLARWPPCAGPPVC